MIRVNLLAARQRGLASSSSPASAVSLSDNQRAQELLKRLGVLAVIPLALFLLEREIIPTKIEERSVAKKRADELRAFNSRQESTRNKIASLQKDGDKFEAQLNALKKLKHSQFYELRLIDLIQDIIPERVWVSSLNFTNAPEGSSNDNKLEISFSTTSENEIDNFFTAISNQRDYFIEVFPSDQKRQRADNPKIKDFGISIIVKKELPSLKNQWGSSTGADSGSPPSSGASPSATPPSGEVKQ